ncbi:hypothetical protein K490DRAFT_56923 [Saccharata proteae CBS 121410]|uniref:CCHC-type domain-containing protein n=1 Tax=Saccharata proteae CBS 121410 TaxID=1314787 RepID=A0A9P4LWR6_9PEZI|nr:hypothetical protein K490DRAFT_56923 [Saccharata proteae CBS 121410]
MAILIVNRSTVRYYDTMHVNNPRLGHGEATWGDWKLRTLDSLEINQLENIVLGKKPKPIAADRLAHALGTERQACEGPLAALDKETAAEMWTELTHRFEPEGFAHAAPIILHWIKMSLNDYSSGIEFADAYLEAWNACNRLKLADLTNAIHVVRFPSEVESNLPIWVAVQKQEFRNLPEPHNITGYIPWVKDEIEWERITRKNDDGKKYVKEDGHKAESLLSTKGRDKNVSCYACKKNGHCLEDCQNEKSFGDNEQNSKNNKESGRLADQEMTSNTNDLRNVWFYGGGSVQYSCYPPSSFENYFTIPPTNFTGSAGGRVQAIAKGDIMLLLKLFDGCCKELRIKHVYHIPDQAGFNVLSSGLLQQQGVSLIKYLREEQS